MPFLAISLLSTLLAALPTAQPVPGDVTVTVNYTGAGVVDDDHKLWVFVLATDSVGPDVQPVAFQAIAKNGGSTTFTNLPGTVFVRTAYSESAGYDPNASGRPTGLPIGMYTTDGKTAAAVAVAPGTKVTIKFDDKVRLP